MRWVWLVILGGCGGAGEETTTDTETEDSATQDSATELTTTNECRRGASDTGTTSSSGCG